LAGGESAGACDQPTEEHSRRCAIGQNRQMPETGEGNIEFAHELSHGHDHAGPHLTRERWHTIVEVLEVIVLAIVAVATAYSGFQAAKWDAEEAHRYGESSTLYTRAATERTAGVQVLAADAATFTAWLQAHDDNKPELQEDLEHRFSPDYNVAFDAWLKTDPFSSDDAPVGPAAMREYHNRLAEQADETTREADRIFDSGHDAAHEAENYVRNTVLFAMVLFLVAMAQRFTRRATRISMNAVAGLILVLVLISLLRLPRI
jgi:hypothetical protein